MRVLEQKLKIQTPATTIKPAAKPRLDANVIHHMLTARTEDFLKTVLGEPKTKTADTWHFGDMGTRDKRGSLAVALRGDKSGLWYDFATGEGGNLITLLMKSEGLEFRSALEKSANWLGLTAGEAIKINAEIMPVNDHAAEFKRDRQRKHMREFAQKLVRESVPVKGSLAEVYLRETRAIDKVLPELLRFHAGVYSTLNGRKLPALLVPVYNKDNKLQAVQAIFLNPATGSKARVAVPKQTFGKVAGYVAKLNPASKFSGICFYAEGLETGLSILQALPQAQVNVLLGSANYKHIPPDNSVTHHVLCLDNDGANVVTHKSVRQAVTTITQMGKQVWVCQPGTIKTDFNDMLRTQGVTAIRQCLAQARGSLTPAGMIEKFTDKRLVKSYSAWAQLSATTIARERNSLQEFKKLSEIVPQTLSLAKTRPVERGIER